MFKTIYKPIKIFDTNIIKPKTKAIYSIREDYFCPVANDFLEYRSYEGIIEDVTEEQVRFISNDNHVNLYYESVHPDVDRWLKVDDIDGYWIKLELV